VAFQATTPFGSDRGLLGHVATLGLAGRALGAPLAVRRAVIAVRNMLAQLLKHRSRPFEVDCALLLPFVNVHFDNPVFNLSYYLSVLIYISSKDHIYNISYNCRMCDMGEMSAAVRFG
jgi:hypothetical protein